MDWKETYFGNKQVIRDMHGRLVPPALERDALGNPQPTFPKSPGTLDRMK